MAQLARRKRCAFAVREARLRGTGLRVITAWHLPTIAHGGGLSGPENDPAVLEERASTAQEAALAALGEQADGIEIERAVHMGQPAQVLTTEARGADLLVVGSRGRGGFAGLLLGSVSHQCALHAPCPIVIVHESTRTA